MQRQSQQAHFRLPIIIIYDHHLEILMVDTTHQHPVHASIQMLQLEKDADNQGDAVLSPYS